MAKKKPAPAGERINIYVPSWLIKEARAYAAAQDRSVSNLIAHLLRTELEGSIWWAGRQAASTRKRPPAGALGPSDKH